MSENKKYKNKAILIDHGSFQFRAIFNYEKNRQIPPTYTYLRMLLSCLKKIGVDKEDIIILAIDSKHGSWRKNFDLNYKKGRKEARQKHNINWQQMWDMFNDLVIRLNIGSPFHAFELEQIEADDIIAVASHFFKDRECVIVSPDHDFYELLDDRVKMFSPLKKYKSKKGCYIDSSKINPYKELMKKIENEACDGLTSAVLTERDFEIRKKIVTLQELPEEVEQPILQILEKIAPKTEFDFRILPHYKLHKDLENIFNSQEAISYSECINYKPRKRKRRVKK